MAAQFQSLFYWIYLSKEVCEVFNVREFLFQSLFYWIYLSKCFIAYNVRNATGVSILVLLDLPFKDSPRRLNISLLRLFQSLFYWIYLSKECIVEHTCFHISVSILVLLDLPFKGFFKRGLDPLLTVSILVLLDLPFKVILMELG